MNELATNAAFPFKFTDRDGTTHVYTGLTVRQHYAGLAMQGMCDGPTAKGAFSDYKKFGVPSAEAMIAKLAVDIADALIAELAKAKP